MIVYAVSNARKAKTEKSLSLKTPLKALILEAKLNQAEFELARDDIIASTKAESVEFKKLDDKSEEEFKHEIVF